jgi:zinc/manganese transport system substrate-binding protein
MRVTKTFIRAVLVLASACVASDAHAGEAKPLKVVASFTILAGWAQIVGREDVSVTTLVGPDSDAHVYEPTPSDVQRVAQADLLIVNGLGFEGWMSRLIDASDFKGKTVVASRGVRVRMQSGQPDPHAWHDLQNAAAYVHNIAEAFGARSPARAARFSARAAAYCAELQALATHSRLQIESIPREQRVAVISHDAFGYLADAYQLRLLPVLGMSTDSEPSAAAVGALIRQIRAHQVHAVFLENIRDPRLVRRIADEARVAIGGRLYSDALGAPGSPAATFVELYRHNIDTLVRALRAEGSQADSQGTTGSNTALEVVPPRQMLCVALR